MKKNKKQKVIWIVVVVIFILCFCRTSYGINVGELTGTAFSNADANKLGNSIVTLLSTIGSIVSVVVLIAIGIKYMLGSIEEKAEYKKSLMPYVVGAILVFSASAIAGYVYKISIGL